MFGTTARDYTVAKKPGKLDTNCVDYLNYIVWNNQCFTPEGKVLAGIIISMVDPHDHTGAISPGDDRLLAMTGWGQATLDAAFEDMVASGQWRVLTDQHGSIRWCWPLFIDDAANTKDQVRQDVKGSMTHFKFAFRYSGLPAAQRMILVQAIAATPARYNPLGSKGQVARYRSPLGKRKVVFNALFTHSVMTDQTREGNAATFATTTVPHDIRHHTGTVPLHKLAAQVGVDATTLSHMLFEPQPYLYVEPQRNGSVRFTPTHSLHQPVWDLNHAAGGADMNDWETRNGFFPEAPEPPVSDDPADGYWCAPPLGDSWVYETYIGDTVLQVGQTTQPGRLRLRQHLLKSTNRYAELTMLHYMSRGMKPSIRIVARAHRYTVAAVEMAHLHYRRAQGHNLSNHIIDSQENARTIKLDSRYAGWSDQAVKKHLQDTYWAEQEFYDRTLAQAEHAANIATAAAMSTPASTSMIPVAA